MDRKTYDMITAQIRNRLDAAEIAMKYGHRGSLEDALANALALLWMLVREVDPAIFVRSARHIQPSANETPIPWWPTDLISTAQYPETD